MRIKTFYTKTMAEALRQVKTHLGPDALLLSTKEVPRRAGVWGASSGFEVVAAVDDAEEIDMFSPSYEADTAAAAARNEEDVPRSVPGLVPEQGTARQFLEQVELETYSPARLIKSANRSRNEVIIPESDLPMPDPAVPASPFKARIPASLYRELVNRGVEASLAQELMTTALGHMTSGQRRSRPALIKAISQAALSFIEDSSSFNGMPAKKVVAFFGPTGVGKTTSIAKLAARLALQQKKKVVLMTTDGYRIGAIEQLRSYAGLMGIPFRFVDDATELPRAIEENTQRDYILIDTAGHGPRDLELMRGLASFFKNSEFMERHLVLSAATKASDMRDIMDRFEMCRPDHLLFTKLDETSTPGPILNELIRTRKSSSYYCNGQRVPDDLHAVPRERLIDIVLNHNENGLKE